MISALERAAFSAGRFDKLGRVRTRRFSIEKRENPLVGGLLVTPPALNDLLRGVRSLR